MFEKTTNRISHVSGSFEPYCRSSGYRLEKLSNVWSFIHLGHILKNRPLLLLMLNFEGKIFSNSAKLKHIFKINSDKHGIQ